MWCILAVVRALEHEKSQVSGSNGKDKSGLSVLFQEIVNDRHLRAPAGAAPAALLPWGLPRSWFQESSDFNKLLGQGDAIDIPPRVLMGVRVVIRGHG
jgi:hypothetical protein